jgi:hypothetical protein
MKIEPLSSDIEINGTGETETLICKFHQLPVRPMFQIDLDVDKKDSNKLRIS